VCDEIFYQQKLQCVARGELAALGTRKTAKDILSFMSVICAFAIGFDNIETSLYKPFQNKTKRSRAF